MLHNKAYTNDLSLVCTIISFSCILECKHMTLAMSTFKNIFPLHIKMQDYHLKYLMCYSKCRSVDIFHFKTLLLLTNGIVLANSVRDTLRPLGPSQIVYVTLNTLNGVVLNWLRGASSYRTRGKAMVWP